MSARDLEVRGSHCTHACEGSALERQQNSAVCRGRFSKDAQRGVPRIIHFNGFLTVDELLDNQVFLLFATDALDKEALHGDCDPTNDWKF